MPAFRRKTIGCMMSTKNCDGISQLHHVSAIWRTNISLCSSLLIGYADLANLESLLKYLTKLYTLVENELGLGQDIRRFVLGQEELRCHDDYEAFLAHVWPRLKHLAGGLGWCYLVSSGLYWCWIDPFMLFGEFVGESQNFMGLRLCEKCRYMIRSYQRIQVGTRWR